MADSPSPGGRRSAFRATLAASLGALVIGGLGLMTVGATGASAADDNDKKVTLCHATSSESNPYVMITVSVNAVKDEGHLDHANDIIPPFDDFPGKNLDNGGQAILDNGCQKPEETKTETATATATETATSTATSTETATATALSTVTATATVTAPAASAAAESPTATTGAGEAGQSPSSSAVSGGEAATGPTSAKAGGGAGSSNGAPTWALGLLAAGVIGAALSSIGLVRSR